MPGGGARVEGGFRCFVLVTVGVLCLCESAFWRLHFGVGSLEQVCGGGLLSGVVCCKLWLRIGLRKSSGFPVFSGIGVLFGRCWVVFLEI